MKAFFAALQFLTIFPRPWRFDYSADEVGPSLIFFPAVGLLLGGMLAAANGALDMLANPLLSSILLVAILALLTRGLHLDGLADTADGIGAGTDRERALTAMADSHTGAFGVIAIVLILLLKVHALEAIEWERWRALLLAPVLGRWAMVLLGYRSRAAKSGLGAILLEQLKTKYLLGATLLAAFLSAAILRLTGILLMGCVALVTLAARKYFHHRLGGVSGDTFGAVGEISETSVFFFLALETR